MLLFIDTDLNFPSDDFQALMLVLAEGRVRLVGCGAVAGNTWAEEVFANLHEVKSLLGEHELKIWKGAPYTAFGNNREQAIAQNASGVRNFVGAHGKAPRPRSWVTGSRTSEGALSSAAALADMARKNPGEISVLCLGPLTNLDEALRIEPDLPELLQSVTVMGGYFSRQDRADKIDFNFWFDAAAAQRVLASGLKIRLVPLDVCQDARLTTGLLERLNYFNRGRAALFVDDFLGMARQHGSSMALADQLATILHLYPQLILKAERVRVDVDVSESETRGRSIAVAQEDSQVFVVRHVDVDAVHDRLIGLVERMCEQFVEPIGLFQSPAYRYFIGERLSRGPLTLIQTLFGARYQQVEPVEIATIEQFIEAVTPLASILIRAKARKELWPPAPRADAKIAAVRLSEVADFDFLTTKELEHVAFSRLIGVRAIATVAPVEGDPKGFTCLSTVTPSRREFLHSQFGLAPETSDLIAECSYVERRSCGLFALEYMESGLYVWALAQLRARDQTNLFGVCLSSQTASRQKLLSMGYKPVADHTIPDGFEKGRVLTLYSQPLDTSLIDKLRMNYGNLGPL